jgi:alkylation response protein AidB-like acyl-CoA dehydrogenase
MDLRLTPAQQLLVHSARSLLDQRCPVARGEPRGPRDARALAPALWKELAALGWPGLLIPSSLGGGDGGALDAVLLVEELGRACAPGPFIESAVVSTRLLLDAGAHPRARDLLPRLAVGERVCTVAVLEDEARLEPDALAMRVEAGRRSGRKLFVPGADLASDVIVIGRGAGGVDAVLLPLDRAGIQVRPLDDLAGGPTFEVAFDDVEIADHDRIGAAGAGWALAEPALSLGALARSADMVGAAARILELCVEHVRGRVQFGRPIGSFQAVQHACADLLRDVEASRWLTCEAAWRVDGGDPEQAAAVAAAAAHAAEACLRVARRGHQLMGAIGYSEEHPLHLLHKRILAGSVAWGGQGEHLERVARSIGLG